MLIKWVLGVLCCDSYRWPGSLRRQVICSHSIDYVGFLITGVLSVCWKISTTWEVNILSIPALGYRFQATSFDICNPISVWRSLSKCVYWYTKTLSGHGVFLSLLAVGNSTKVGTVTTSSLFEFYFCVRFNANTYLFTHAYICIYVRDICIYDWQWRGQRGHDVVARIEIRCVIKAKHVLLVC